jgi:uncharacterized membrane protein YgaE (UPF0421/DUF939 family)
VELRGATTRSWTRVRAGTRGALQCGLAASLAWAFSVHVLGHPRPFFASVAAVVALGLRAGQRLRRTAELAVGVALGVLIGDLLVGLIGSGSWQIGVVVAFALLVAVAFGGTGLVVTQAGLQAVFVVALPRTPNSGLHRWQDALVGGAVALLVAALLSTSPWRDADRARQAYVGDLARVLRSAATAIRARSADEMLEVLAAGRALEPGLQRWSDAIAAGRDTERLSPHRGDRGEHLRQSQRLTIGMSRASRNLRVLVRRAVAALQAGHPLPDCLPELLDELSESLEVVAAGGDALPRLLDLAGRLDPAALGATTLAGQITVGQLRVALIDLLEGLGLEHDRARNALPALVA